MILTFVRWRNVSVIVSLALLDAVMRTANGWSFVCISCVTVCVRKCVLKLPKVVAGLRKSLSRSVRVFGSAPSGVLKVKVLCVTVGSVLVSGLLVVKGVSSCVVAVVRLLVGLKVLIVSCGRRLGMHNLLLGVRLVSRVLDSLIVGVVLYASVKCTLEGLLVTSMLFVLLVCWGR